MISLGLQDSSKSNNNLSFANSATTTIQQRTAQGHHRAETMDQLATLNSYFWLPLDAEIAMAFIAQIVVDSLHVKLAQVDLQKSS